MKITAYEVREDETEIMKKLADKLGIDELVTTAEPLTLDTAHLAKGAAGVTTLGQSIIDEKVCQALKNAGVKGYSTRTVGYNHVNLKAASEAGIRVSNATYSPHGVAEYTVMLILMTLRNYKPALYRINVNDYSLNGLIGKELHDMTVGIIGTGKIGAAVIKNLSGFGCKILAHSRHEDEQIGVLALDVFENENGIYHHDRKTDIIKNKDMAYLRQFPNVIMTQHMAFYTEQAVISMVHCGLESLVAFAENKEYRCQLQ
ncbi:MAG: lactate dehydrogenase [Blautia sp.]|uniref:NAD(P)-dependent oxidoreductase n=1 Tax=Blautia sp. TaxID=1955243 RepID=UPI0025C45B55|nr:NAD(P)-dependent oxidoreductase [Blautia sp.]MCI6303257.1 lactate dehydrogenase [Blautia sp.]